MKYALTLACAAVVGAGMVAGGSAVAGTLDDVRAAGSFSCGTNPGLPGFSYMDSEGNWAGLDVDYCRAMSAAIFGDPDKVKFVPVSSKERFTALQSGEIDVLSKATTWTSTRDTSMGLNFVGVDFYDGQGFMVPESLDVNSALELSGAAICTETGTTTERNIGDYFRTNGMEYKIVAFEKNEEVARAYSAGRCDVYTSDASALYSMRLKLADADQHIVLPEIISKEPLGPVVRQGDDQWFNIAKWTLFAMINAEELGITSANVDELRASSDNPEVLRFLGNGGDYGESMGLSADWAYQIVKQVGNYGEMYDRTVGKDSPLKIERGLNALWTDGGILYAPPIR